MLNKVDHLADKEKMLPFIDSIKDKYRFHDIIPISAKNGYQTDQLESQLKVLIPKSPFMFPSDQITNRSERFIVAEIIREKLVRLLGEELPYETAVEIEAYKQDGGMLFINALILVERKGQKKIRSSWTSCTRRYCKQKVSLILC